MVLDPHRYGPWAVIAGASEGVGAAFAHKFGSAGLNLVLIARKQAVLEEVAREVVAETGVEVRTLALDLTSLDMLEQVAGVTDDVEVGLLVYNAGANQSMRNFLEAPLETALRVVRLNPVGQVSLAYHFGTQMAARGRGGIILIGSLAGSAGATPLVAYNASKAFTQIFAEGLWSELKPQGVDVLYRMVGAVDTPNRRRQRPSTSATKSLSRDDDPNQLVEAPETVAQTALDGLADGPVYVPGHLTELFRQLTTSPRAEASQQMYRMLHAFNE